MNITTISSAQNEKFKFLKKILNDNHFRRKNELFLVEGWKELQFAIDSSYEIESIFIRHSFVNIQKLPHAKQFFFLENHLFDQIAYRNEGSNFISIVKQKLPQPLPKYSNGLVIVLEGIEKPGNLGAILRTCDAVGATSLVLCNSRVDVYNPNVIRSSVGTSFSVPTFSASNENTLKWLTLNHYLIFGASIQNSISMQNIVFPIKSALVFGEEHGGLSNFWKSNIEHKIFIPMFGKNDSLNLSVSVGVITYAYRSQHIEPMLSE